MLYCCLFVSHMKVCVLFHLKESDGSVFVLDVQQRRVAFVKYFIYFLLLFQLSMQTVDLVSPEKRVWLGETSSAYGGGALGLSDTFAAGFM